MKVYLVTSGCYSDYYVRAVFTTKEKAEAYIGEKREHDEIEEYELDAYDNHVHKMVYTSTIDIDSGEIKHGYSGMSLVPEHERASEVKIIDLKRGGLIPDLGWTFGRLCAEVVSYESYEHADKLAAEARQSYQRNQAVAQ